MKRKGLTSIMIVVGAIMLLSTPAGANVPPPPANQLMGVTDTVFNNLTEAECRVCHPAVVNDHHLLYDEDIPQGACSVNSNDCIKTTYCDPDICSNSGADCSVDGDCPEVGLGESCGEVCIGQSAIINPDTDGSGPDSTYSCLSCHPQQINNGVIEFIVIRDCLVCHVQIPGQASVHHLTPAAQSGECVSCHGDIVDNIGDGHIIPSYAPSLVTPVPSDGIGEPVNSLGNGAGACNYCHDAGDDTSTGAVIEVVKNLDAHLNTGVFLSPTGVTNQDACLWCHPVTGNAMRTCEGCHGYESLHNIQVDSDTGCVYDPANPGACNITVGGEAAGWGHVGRDAGAGDSDCWGCHGNYIPGAVAAAAGPVVPFIDSVDLSSIIAGTETPITLTGVAFTNMIMDFQWVSDVMLTAADGSSTTLTPDSISQSSLTVTIPDSTPAGNYTLQAVKGDLASSNPVGITVIPNVVIAGDECTGETLYITGSGFGDTQPEGAAQYLNSNFGGMTAEIISWTDTEIVAAVPFCSDAVTVNALFGSPTTCDCEGNFDGDEDTDGTDIHTFKMDFGRSPLQIPCEDGSMCNGDFDCDEDVDGTDAFKMKEDFGRSPLGNPCAPVSVEQWCAY
jgi:hypothetical protein